MSFMPCGCHTGFEEEISFYKSFWVAGSPSKQKLQPCVKHLIQLEGHAGFCLYSTQWPEQNGLAEVHGLVYSYITNFSN